MQVIRYIFIILVICSCTSQKTVNESKVRISLPSQNSEEEHIIYKDKLPSVVEMKDHLGNVTIYAQTETGKDGNSKLSIQLDEVQVTSRIKNTAERAGKINLDFIVTVPVELVNSKCQLTLAPVVLCNDNVTEYEDLVISGKEYYKNQLRQYRKYEKFLESIVPDSLYNYKLIDLKAYHKYLNDYYKSENKRIIKDSLDYINYLNYVNLLEKRYNGFNNKMYRNNDKLHKKNHLDKIKNRYQYFDRNLDSLLDEYEKYNELFARLLPQFHLYRRVDEKVVNQKYTGDFKLSGDITVLNANDSAYILQYFAKNKEIEKNEWLKANKDNIFSKLVRNPKNHNAVLDTVISDNGKFEYYYHLVIPAVENSQRIKLYLRNYIQPYNKDKSWFGNSDTLNYLVSSMVQLVDTTPRYIRKIIERKATSSLSANIFFNAGKFNLDLSLSNNQEEINKIFCKIDELLETGEFVLDSIPIIASCSPDGSYEDNLRLSGQRAEAIKKVMLEELKHIEGIHSKLIALSKGEDWEKLAELIKEDTNLKYKDKILGIISSSLHPDSKEKKIISQFNKDFSLIRKNLYPHLRYVDFTFHLHRKGMVKDTIHTTEPDTVYLKGIDLLNQRKYNEALTILNDYQDWNTAICLMSLGYDSDAYEIFLNEKENADREYLLAVLAARLNKIEEAIKRYLRSCELDPAKKWRGRLDPEITTLAENYSLFDN